MGVLPASLHQLCAWCPWKLEESFLSSETVFTDGYEPPCGCWEWNLYPLEEQPVPLATDPSLQTPSKCFFDAQQTLLEEGEKEGESHR